MLPANPSQNRDWLKLLYVHQYGMATIITRTLTIKYAVKESLLGSKLTLSLVNVFVRIPLVVKDIGVIIANNTGTQVGARGSALLLPISPFTT